MIYADDNIHDAIEKVAGVRSTLSRIMKAPGKKLGAKEIMGPRKEQILKRALEYHEARIAAGAKPTRFHPSRPKAISRFRKRVIY